MKLELTKHEISFIKMAISFIEFDGSFLRKEPTNDALMAKALLEKINTIEYYERKNEEELEA